MTNESERDALRERMRAIRDGLSQAKRESADLQIHQQLWGVLEHRGGTGLASYSAIRSEVDLAAFHAAWLESGGELFLPRTLGAGKLEFARYFTEEPLRTGAYGIAEPTGPAVDLSAIDAVVVPGLAFDATGGRLGYGAGYYDRFLERLGRETDPRAVFVGVAYDEQIVEHVPMFDHDVPLDWIVSDRQAVRAMSRK